MEVNNQPATDALENELMQALRVWLQSLRANLEARAKILAELRAAASGRQ
jgi:hypothetical protein